MNRWTKIAIGWLVWTIGTLLFAHLTTNAPGPETGTNTVVEFAYGAFVACYLIGVPILTGLWMLEPVQPVLKEKE